MTDVCITIDPVTKEPLRCNDPNDAKFNSEFCRTPFQWDGSPNCRFTTGSKSWLPVAENFERVNLEEQTLNTGRN